MTLEKKSSKTSRSHKTVLTNKTSVNQCSCFRYGAFTNSSLEIFDEDPVFETINNLLH